jgi:murein L,D-transpeptidase YafK
MARRVQIMSLWFLPVICIVTVLIAVNWHSDPLPANSVADRIEVFKARRTLELWKGDHLLKRYTVSLGHNAIGPKVREGDSRTPEGTYRIDSRNPTSRFHLALHISYPDSMAVKQASALKVSPGGMIMVHGLRNGLGWIGTLQRLVDWTDGCIAVTDPEIEEIWRAVPDSTAISIHP